MNIAERYPSESPHRALAEWLDSWATQDWDRMVMANVPTWRNRQEDPRGALVGAYEHLRLVGWSVPMKKPVPVARVDNPMLSDGRPFIVFCDVPCRARFVVMGVGEDGEPVAIKEVATTIVARLVRETVDGLPAERDNPAGRWWVNPVSMTRGDPARTKVRTLAA